jgi:hypothetical protein
MRPYWHKEIMLDPSPWLKEIKKTNLIQKVRKSIMNVLNSLIREMISYAGGGNMTIWL